MVKWGSGRTLSLIFLNTTFTWRPFWKMAAISFQQNIVRVVHLEVVQGGPPNTLIPNTCLQQPMSGESGLPPGYGCRAHDTRSVSSSWALFNGASLKVFQQAAYWSSPNTFILCYLKDVLAAEASFASAVLKSFSCSRGAGVAPRVPVVSM